MSTGNLERAFASTRSVLANVTDDQLSAPTPCRSWQVRQLVNHIIGTSFWFAGAVNAGVAPDMADTDFAAGDRVATYDDGIAQAVAAFGKPGALETMVKLPFGTLPCAAYLGIATNDAFTHGWDLARVRPARRPTSIPRSRSSSSKVPGCSSSPRSAATTRRAPSVPSSPCPRTPRTPTPSLPSSAARCERAARVITCRGGCAAPPRPPRPVRSAPPAPRSGARRGTAGARPAVH